MGVKLSSRVTFDITRLFNGAVDVDWLVDDPSKASKAASAYVFHGPGSHGVSNGDIGETSHQLIDTASFVKRVLSRVHDSSGNAFTLAIAGFGSGKSHLAVTISELLAPTDEEVRRCVIQHIAEVDKSIGDAVAVLCRNIGKVLVITLNGMNGGDLSSALLTQIKRRIKADGLDVSKLDNLKQRFKSVSSMLQMFDAQAVQELVDNCAVTSKDEILARLEGFDEETYIHAHEFLSRRAIRISASGDETAKDVIKRTVECFVGPGKAYSHLLVVFDEFGHYMEYATAHPQLAGDGALQLLFEGVQSQESTVTFLGFVQYELKAYEQRLTSVLKNEIRRFITRYDNSDKLYLSSNLETLIANLLVKTGQPEIDYEHSERERRWLAGWYPVSQNFSTWSDPKKFQQVIARGCWPLSPAAMWVLFYLSSSGRFLQQRSALTLLQGALEKNADIEDVAALPPVALWTEALQKEFESIEEDSAHGNLMQSYNAVMSERAQHLSHDCTAVLRCVILLSQTQLRASGRGDVDLALEVFSGLDDKKLQIALGELQNTFNVLEWDEATRSYQILSDTASRPQFMRLIRKRSEEFDEEREAELFCKLIIPTFDLKEYPCAFAETNQISTKTEWSFVPSCTHWEMFKKTLPAIAESLASNMAINNVDNPRGALLYCYVSQNADIEDVQAQAAALLKRVAKRTPILLVLIRNDQECKLSMALVQLEVLRNLTAEERASFGQLIPAQEQRQQQILAEALKTAILERRYVSSFEEVNHGRIRDYEDGIFSRCFPKVLPFPFDGYATSRGNAPTTCAEFTRRLFSSGLSFNDITTMDSKSQNRAKAVFIQSWQIYAANGSVLQKPKNPVVRTIFAEFEKLLSSEHGLNCGAAIRLACAYPYGANKASSVLLLGVFVQAFQNVILMQEGNSTIGPETFVGKLYSGMNVDLDYLETVTFYRTTGEHGAWDELIQDWECRSTYQESVEFLERIDRLGATSVPRELKIQIEGIQREAKAAATTINEIEEQESQCLEKIEQGMALGKTTRLATGASMLLSLVRDRLQKDSMWPRSDIDAMTTHVNEAKLQLASSFSSWLQRKQPTGDTADALAEFKRKLDQMGRCLRNLQMREELEALNTHVTRASRSFEVIADARARISDYDAWASQCGIIAYPMKIRRLKDLAATCESKREMLKKSLAVMRHQNNQFFVTELSTRVDDAGSKLDAISKVKREASKQGGKIMNQQLLPDTAQTILDSLKEIMDIYEGEEKDVEDFRVMRNEVTAYVDIYHRLEPLTISQDQFAALVRAAREEFIRFDGDEDNPPTWKAAEAFDVLVSRIERRRERASAEWVAKIRTEFSDIDGLTMQDAEAARQRLLSPPPYFGGDRDIEVRNVILRKLDKFLEGKGVEWLVEKYNQLSPAGKKLFMKAVGAVRA